MELNYLRQHSCDIVIFPHILLTTHFLMLVLIQLINTTQTGFLIGARQLSRLNY